MRFAHKGCAYSAPAHCEIEHGAKRAGCSKLLFASVHIILANLEIISKIINHPTWEVVVVFFFIAAGFFYGLSTGKTKLIAALISLYVSGLIFENLSYLDYLTKSRPPLDAFLIRGASFAILILLLAFIFNRLLRHDNISGTRVWWQVFLLSFLETGLLISLVFRLLPTKGIFTLSPLVQIFFTTPTAFFWWLILPLVALFVTIKKR